MWEIVGALLIVFVGIPIFFNLLFSIPKGGWLVIIIIGGFLMLIIGNQLSSIH